MTGQPFPQCLGDPGRSLSSYMFVHLTNIYQVPTVCIRLEGVREQSPEADMKVQSLGRLSETKCCLFPAGAIPHS